MSLLRAPFPERTLADRFNEWPEWRKRMGLVPHRGLDWNGIAHGSGIRASGDGVVTWRTNLTDAQAERTALGHRIVVRYAIGGAPVFIGYSHLAANPGRKVDEKVTTRDDVGLLGNSGSATTGDHLHMTASWQNGDPGSVGVIDPLPFFTFSATPAGSTTEAIQSLMEGEMDVRLVRCGASAKGPNAVFLWNRKTNAKQWVEDTYRLGILQQIVGRSDFAELADENQLQFAYDEYKRVFQG